ncbi:mannose-6-phosphate isomerase, class I [Vibrio mangrovi]|uniref:mannose-6-phosphate isomerase n=1 Tax=Vibrio mangrovi TaxID=474394 RepID=A0A1Y6IZN1_9VIBR|nr:mannose-6-phosphate isomerase, class I [Vibrio mangrovi]MDW6002148.1 mannose-6-phosphate isomerase, class I [Vibrio mangrovi]SMS01493.1 Mannose-6-phosphate isomerase [Vibrio mangrovi]
MNDTTILPFYLMQNVIQNYAWGSTQSINHLFNIPNPEHQPQAEIWMGAHPGGCSQIISGNQQHSLAGFIQSHLSLCLSEQIRQAYGALPFLFKVLAAEKALSIQVHPCKQDAEIGFAQENQQQIPLDAPQRNYKDPNHKPELVYALTPYHALNGFRPLEEIIQTLTEMNILPIESLVNQLRADRSESGFQSFFVHLLSLSGEQKSLAIQALLAYAAQYQEENRLARLILELAQDYPEDIGLFSAILLHYVVLQPGEAMYLDARTPHAYLKGTGLEVMASSDNVLRAGLTPKHIDVQELAKCTSFAPKPKETLLVSPKKEGEIRHYPVPVSDFKFSIYPMPADITLTTTSAEIIFAIDDVVHLHHENGMTLSLQKGQSAFVPASACAYTLSSSGRVARVYN